MAAYYNEVDPYAAAWLRNLVAGGLVQPGDVDERSIVDVQADDLRGYVQCHFFAGIGGWAYAARLAGWADDRPLWTGSCPCQPFSVAGQRAGASDPRHLWPDFFRLIRAARPPVVMGEQVAGAAGYGWFDGVQSDLASEGYASRGVDIPACAVDAPHIRSRLYWCAVADAESAGWQDGNGIACGNGPSCTCGFGHHACGLAKPARQRPERRQGFTSRHEHDRQAARWPQGHGCAAYGHEDGSSPMGDAPRVGWGERRAEPILGSGGAAVTGADVPSDLGNSSGPPFGVHARKPLEAAQGERGTRQQDGRCPIGLRIADDGRNGTFWSDAEWLQCHDGKARRAQPGTPLLAHGIPNRVALWRGFGNAIVPQVAAEVIGAFMDCAP